MSVGALNGKKRHEGNATAPFRWLSVAAAALSLVALVQHGFALPDFSGPFQFLLGADDEFKRVLLIWAEPFIQQAVAVLNHWTGWTLLLYGYWKHVVILLWLYFWGGAKRAWGQGYKWGAVFRVIWGGLIALPAGVAFGVVPMEPASAAALAHHLDTLGIHVGGRVGLNILSVLIPVLAVTLFVLGIAVWVASAYDRDGKSWWAVFLRNATSYPVAFGYVGGAAVALALALYALPRLRSTIEALPNPGLILLMVLIAGLALFLRWSDRRLERKDNLGLLMFQSIGGAIAFIAADATWNLVTPN